MNGPGDIKLLFKISTHVCANTFQLYTFWRINIMHLSITESIIVFCDFEFFLVNYCHVVFSVCVFLFLFFWGGRSAKFSNIWKWSSYLKSRNICPKMLLKPLPAEPLTPSWQSPLCEPQAHGCPFYFRWSKKPHAVFPQSGHEKQTAAVACNPPSCLAQVLFAHYNILLLPKAQINHYLNAVQSNFWSLINCHKF